MAIDPINPFSPRSPFDAIRHVDDNSDGSQFEYWSAREAMDSLGYSRWENMENIIRKAKIACRNSGREVDDNFRDVTKVIGRAGPPQRDVQMTRYAMYLLAMSGWGLSRSSGRTRHLWRALPYWRYNPAQRLGGSSYPRQSRT